MHVRYLVCRCCADLREHETSLRSCNNEAHRCTVAMYHRSYMVHDRVHFAARFFVSPYLHFVPSFALPLHAERKKKQPSHSTHDGFCSKYVSFFAGNIRAQDEHTIFSFITTKKQLRSTQLVLSSSEIILQKKILVYNLIFVYNFYKFTDM